MRFVTMIILLAGTQAGALCANTQHMMACLSSGGNYVTCQQSCPQNQQPTDQGLYRLTAPPSDCMIRCQTSGRPEPFCRGYCSQEE